MPVMHNRRAAQVDRSSEVNFKLNRPSEPIVEGLLWEEREDLDLDRVGPVDRDTRLSVRVEILKQLLEDLRDLVRRLRRGQKTRLGL